MMADLFPTDPKRIRERIRRYERALKRELEEGYGGDGYGKRFLQISPSATVSCPHQSV